MRFDYRYYVSIIVLCLMVRARQREENPELQNIPENLINANLVYLIDKHLINGKKYYTADGVLPSATDITAWGMDIVEKILNKSLNSLDNSISSEINNEETTVKKLDKFYEKCVKIQPMCDIAVGSVKSMAH